MVLLGSKNTTFEKKKEKFLKVMPSSLQCFYENVDLWKRQCHVHAYYVLAQYYVFDSVAMFVSV